MIGDGGGLCGLTTADGQNAASLVRVTNAEFVDLRGIFESFGVDQKAKIRRNVPFYVRWVCSDSTMLYKYICKKVGANALTLKKDFLSDKVRVRRHPKRICDTFLPSPPPSKMAPQVKPFGPRDRVNPGGLFKCQPMPARQRPGVQGLAAARPIDANAARLANATTLTFVRHNGTQYVLKDQHGLEMSVNNLAELPRLCPNLRVLNLAGCKHIDVAYFQNFRAIENINFIGCSNLRYVDVSHCPNLRSLTLPSPLPSTADGRASLITTGSHNLVPPEKTWFANEAGHLMRYGNNYFKYGAMGELLVAERNTWRPCQSLDTNLLPQRHPLWRAPANPPPPRPALSPGINPQQPAQAQAVRGPAAATPVSVDQNATHLANATELKFKNVKIGQSGGLISQPVTTYNPVRKIHSLRFIDRMPTATVAATVPHERNLENDSPMRFFNLPITVSTRCHSASNFNSSASFCERGLNS